MPQVQVTKLMLALLRALMYLDARQRAQQRGVRLQ